MSRFSESSGGGGWRGLSGAQIGQLINAGFPAGGRGSPAPGPFLSGPRTGTSMARGPHVDGQGSPCGWPGVPTWMARGSHRRVKWGAGDPGGAWKPRPLRQVDAVPGRGLVCGRAHTQMRPGEPEPGTQGAHGQRPVRPGDTGDPPPAGKASWFGLTFGRRSPPGAVMLPQNRLPPCVCERRASVRLICICKLQRKRQRRGAQLRASGLHHPWVACVSKGGPGRGVGATGRALPAPAARPRGRSEPQSGVKITTHASDLFLEH